MCDLCNSFSIKNKGEAFTVPKAQIANKQLLHAYKQKMATE